MNIVKMMNPKVNTIFLHADDTVRQGLEVILHHGYTALPVLDENDKYLGCVTEGDFLRHMLEVGSTDVKDFERYEISDILRPDFCSPLEITATEEEVVSTVLKQNFVPIVDARKCLCGIITRRAVISCLAEQNHIG